MSFLYNPGGSSGGTGLAVSDAIVAIGHPADAANSRAIASGTNVTVTDNGAGSTVVVASPNSLQSGNNLSDVALASTARTNLGLGTLATQSGTFSGTSSGTNTGDQTVTLTSDVTGSGTGSFATTIANQAVTYAKMQNVSATSKFLGRKTAGAGSPEELSNTDAKTILAIAYTDVSGIATVGHTGVYSDLTGTPTLGTASAHATGDFCQTANNLSDVASAAPAFNNINPMTTKGDIIYASATATGGTAVRLGIGSNTNLLSITAGIPAWIAQSSLSIANTQVTGLGTLSTQNGTFSGTSSGTNTGDQTITLTGNVTGSGTGSFATTIANNAVTTATINAAAVTYAKVQNVAASSILGNPTGSPAAPSEITLGTNLSFAGTVLNATGGGSGITTGKAYALDLGSFSN